MLCYTRLPHRLCPSSLVLQGRVTYYCHDRTNGNGTTPTSCLEATQAQIDTFTSSMSACFRTIVDAGLNIALSPHLDDGLGYGMHTSCLAFPLQVSLV